MLSLCLESRAVTKPPVSLCCLVASVSHSFAVSGLGETAPFCPPVSSLEDRVFFLSFPPKSHRPGSHESTRAKAAQLSSPAHSHPILSPSYPILSYPISEPERLISVTVIPTRLPPSLPFSSPQYKLLRSRQLSLRVDSLFSSQPVEKACLPPVVSSLSLSRSLFLSLRFLSAGGPLRLPGLVNDQRVLLLSILLLPATLPRSGQQNK